MPHNPPSQLPGSVGLAGIGIFTLLFISVAFAEEIRYDSGARRDPFIPLIGEGGMLAAKGFDPNGLNVEGIIFDPIEGSMVLINGELYKQGDHVLNANIINIFNDRVIFSQDDEEKTIWIREEIVEEAKKEHGTKPKQNKEGGVGGHPVAKK